MITFTFFSFLLLSVTSYFDIYKLSALSLLFLQDQDHLVTVEYEDLDLNYRLPVWRKICFAIGGAPYQTTNTVINFFISIFLLEVAEVLSLHLVDVVTILHEMELLWLPVCFPIHRDIRKKGLLSIDGSCP